MSAATRPPASRALRGQMAVELAALIPVCIVCALVVYNLCRFVEACATFDRVALDAVVTQGTTPRDGRSSAEGVASCIRRAVGMRGCEVGVEVRGRGGRRTRGGALAFAAAPRLVTYVCTLRYRPWPGTFVLAGVPFRPPLALTHTRELVVDCDLGEVV